MLSLSRSFPACQNDNTEFAQEEQDLLFQNLKTKNLKLCRDVFLGALLERVSRAQVRLGARAPRAPICQFTKMNPSTIYQNGRTNSVTHYN